MQNIVGRRIALLIFEKGFPSIRSFANYMKEMLPYEYVSEDTIANVVKGKEVRKGTLLSIAKVLELPIECLTKEKLILIDDYLKEEVEPLKEEFEKGLSCKEDREVNDLKTVKYLYDLSKRFYPSDASEMFRGQQKYHITTLAELSIYLPLCKAYIFSDVIYRIGGEIENYETYVLKQYEWLYNEIPNIPAKKYADYCVMKLRLEGKEILNAEEENMKKRLELYWETDEYEDDYEQYRNIIKQNYDLHHNNIIRGIFETQFPILYEDEIKWRKNYKAE